MKSSLFSEHRLLGFAQKNAMNETPIDSTDKPKTQGGGTEKKREELNKRTERAGGKIPSLPDKDKKSTTDALRKAAKEIGNNLEKNHAELKDILMKPEFQRARDIMIQARLTEKEIVHRLVILKNVQKAPVASPERYTSPETLNTDNWEIQNDFVGLSRRQDIKAKGRPTEAIKNIWEWDNKTITNKIKGSRLRNLIILKAQIDLADPTTLQAIDQYLEEKDIPEYLPDYMYESDIKPESGEYFEADELLPGDLLSIENPYYYHQKTIPGDNDLYDDDEDYANLFYLGDGKVMSMFQNPEKLSPVMTITDYRKKLCELCISKGIATNPKLDDFKISKVARANTQIQIPNLGKIDQTQSNNDQDVAPAATDTTEPPPQKAILFTKDKKLDTETIPLNTNPEAPQKRIEPTRKPVTSGPEKHIPNSSDIKAAPPPKQSFSPKNSPVAPSKKEPLPPKLTPAPLAKAHKQEAPLPPVRVTPQRRYNPTNKPVTSGPEKRVPNSGNTKVPKAKPYKNASELPPKAIPLTSAHLVEAFKKETPRTIKLPPIPVAPQKRIEPIGVTIVSHAGAPPSSREKFPLVTVRTTQKMAPGQQPPRAPSQKNLQSNRKASERPKIIPKAKPVTPNQLRYVPQYNRNKKAIYKKEIIPKAKPVTPNQLRNVPKPAPMRRASEKPSIIPKAIPVTPDQLRNVPKAKAIRKASERPTIIPKAIPVRPDQLRRSPISNPIRKASERPNLSPIQKPRPSPVQRKQPSQERVPITPKKQLPTTPPAERKEWRRKK